MPHARLASCYYARSQSLSLFWQPLPCESEPLLERASVEFVPKGFQADGGIEWRRARLGLRGCVWVHAMQAAQVEPSSLSHKGLAGWLGWLAGWLWVQGRRPYAKPGSQCLKGADWLAGTS